MREDYERLFNHLQSPELPGGLLAKIIYRINEERRFLTIRRRIFLFSIGLVGSLVAFIPAFKMAKSGLIESGFTQFFSLLFSDAGIVIANWQSYSYSLLETLPVLGLMALLATVLVFLESLKLLSKDIRDIKYILPHHN